MIEKKNAFLFNIAGFLFVYYKHRPQMFSIL